MKPATTPSRHRTVRDRGSITVEAAWGLLIFLALIPAVFIAGSVPDADAAVNTAADSAARAASLQFDPAVAGAAAEQEAARMLPTSCTSPVVTVDTSDFEAGGTVSATVTCTLDTLWAGTRTISHSATAPVDQWRSGGET